MLLDGLKIYPTLVIRGTGLYELYKTGAYKNYSPERLIELLARIMAMVPPWVRVYRVQRDIPMPLVTSGVKHGNIRELVLQRMSDLGACRVCMVSLAPSLSLSLSLPRSLSLIAAFENRM